MGPMVTPEAKERAELLIESSQEEGVEVLLDGRWVRYGEWMLSGFCLFFHFGQD